MVSNSSEPIQKCDSKTTRHYPKWITRYIKDKRVTHESYIYSFVLIITDLSVEHLLINLFVVVDCIVSCFIKKRLFCSLFC